MLTRRTTIALVLVFLASLPAVTKRVYASDEVQYFAWLRSVAFDRNADFENEYQYFYDQGVSRTPGYHETFLERRNDAGRRINYATIGSAVLWAPFYAAGHLAALATGAPADGYSRPYVAAVAIGSAAYGFGAMVLSALIARRVVGRGLAAALIIAFGTPIVFYSYIAPVFGHATSAFAVALFLWTWLVVRDRWTLAGALALGLTGGVMAMVREQDVLLTIGPGLDFLIVLTRRMREGRVTATRVVSAALIGIAGFALAYAPQFFAYRALNGGFAPDDTVTRKLIWTSPHALSVLFSPDHGLFAWTPLALLAIAGLVWLAAGRARTAHQDASRLAWLMLLMFAAQVYTSGSVDSWTVSGAFGQRRFVALTPILTIGVAAFLAASLASPLARRAAIAVVILCVWWNIGLMMQFGLNRMDRKRLTLIENARQTYLVLPLEAPGIAWRYFTDRSSFYRPPG
jgi:hypothetical protein